MSAGNSAGVLRLAFIGWNEFQLTTFGRLIDVVFHDCRCEILLVDPPSGFSSPTDVFLRSMPAPVKAIARQHIRHIDEFYDVIVAQTVFPGIEEVGFARIVFLQYGLAKENYNYGAWRSLADLNVVFGPYSSACLDFFCRTFVVGNYLAALARPVDLPRKPVGAKKALLYLPTWGELSSQDIAMSVLERHACRFDIYVKPHHNTLSAGQFLASNLAGGQVKIIQDSGLSLYDYLSGFDLVISDWSGALFDALYADKSVILLRLEQHYAHRMVEGLDGLDSTVERLVCGVARSAGELDVLLQNFDDKKAVDLRSTTLLGQLFFPRTPESVRTAVREAVLAVPGYRPMLITRLLRCLVKSRMVLQKCCARKESVVRLPLVVSLRLIASLEKCVDFGLGVRRRKVVGRD